MRSRSRALLALALFPLLASTSGCVQYNEQCQPLVEEPGEIIGYLGEDVPLDKPSARHDNHAIGQLAADAFRDAFTDTSSPADLGVFNGGAIRAEGICVTRERLFAGPLKRGLLYEVLLFENIVTAVDLTEAELVAIFERAASRLSPAGEPITSPPGGFLQISAGTELEINCTKPAGERVAKLVVDGREVDLTAPSTDLEERFRIAVPSFLLQGGDGYAELAAVSSDPSRNPVQAQQLGGIDSNLAADYMSRHYNPETPPEGGEVAGTLTVKQHIRFGPAEDGIDTCARP